MGDTLNKIIKWVFGSKADAQSKLMRSITVEHVSGARVKQGNKLGNNRGAPAGRVAWPVKDLDSHDGAAFLGQDCFWAIYKKADDKVYALDSVLLDDRHQGLEPLVVGKTITLSKPLDKDYFGQVQRTAEYGTAGIKKNVFIAHVPADGSSDVQLVAHHVQGPNVNSTLVFDPNGGDPRQGPLDDQFRVRLYNRDNVAPLNRCGKTNPPQQPPQGAGIEYALYWNCGTSGVNENRGHGLTHFDDAEARLGYGMGGPLRPASRKHLHTTTGDTTPQGVGAEIRAGAIDVNALYTDGSEAFDAPDQFHLREEPAVVESEGIRHRVYHEMDSDWCHTSRPIGQRFGLYRYSVPLPLVETPPCEGTEAAPTYGRIDTNPIFTTGATLNAGSIGLPAPNLHKLAQ